MRIRECGNEKRFLGAPAAGRMSGHGSGLSHAGGNYVGTDVLHRVIDGHARGNRAARGINVELNVALRIFRFQK